MKHILLGIALSAILYSCGEDMSAPGNLVPRTVDQDPSLPSLHINGTQLHTESVGQAGDPLVILIHGGPGADYRSMLKASMLADHGFQVVFYDQRGSGLSKRENENQYEGSGAIQVFIDDLDAILNHYKGLGTQKVFLFGHSWGAMLATAYINQHPSKISGAILAEPGGLTWAQTSEYLTHSNKIKFFSEALNNAVFTEQFFAGRSEHEVLDYKATFFSNYENAPGNAIGNKGHYPFWRQGAVAFQALITNAEKYDFDFTTDLNHFTTKVLFLYSENNSAYGRGWAEKVSAPYPHIDLQQVNDCGHEMLHFGWTDLHPKALNYLNELK